LGFLGKNFVSLQLFTVYLNTLTFLNVISIGGGMHEIHNLLSLEGLVGCTLTPTDFLAGGLIRTILTFTLSRDDTMIDARLRFYKDFILYGFCEEEEIHVVRLPPIVLNCLYYHLTY